MDARAAVKTMAAVTVTGAAAAVLILFSGGQPTRAEDAPPAEKKSGGEAQRELAVTVYNQDFGLVREVREVELGRGRVELEFADVAARIEPHTVHVKSLDGEGAFRVLEQNYRYDLLNPQKLLEKYVGKKVKVYRWNEKTGQDEMVEAEVLAAAEGTVLRIGGEITFNYPGRFAFPEIPENLIAKPSLVWLGESARDRQRLEVSYLTGGLNWKADYVMVIDAKDAAADLTGWVTLANTSGTSYRNARLKLVAGDVQRVQSPRRRDMQMMAMEEAAARAPQFREEGFFEYHLYTLERPATVLDNETKQVTLLEAKGAAVRKRLQFLGQLHWYRSQFGDVASNQKVGVYIELQNSEKDGLGMPLPKGTVRVYKADSSGAQQFIGEDAIDHTPRDEKVRIKMGEAFDVVGDRKQTDWKALGGCVSESAWEVEIRNHKDEAAAVEVIEPIGGDWEVLQASHPWTKLDQNTFRFDLEVPGRGKVTVTYRVRVRWC